MLESTIIFQDIHMKLFKTLSLTTLFLLLGSIFMTVSSFASGRYDYSYDYDYSSGASAIGTTIMLIYCAVICVSIVLSIIIPVVMYLVLKDVAERENGQVDKGLWIFLMIMPMIPVANFFGWFVTPIAGAYYLFSIKPKLNQESGITS